MSWSTREGVDYDDAKRPTADDPTHATGWIAYYAFDRSGGGAYRPRYRFMPGEWSFEEMRDTIVSRWESWLEHGSGTIVIHRGVTPPLEAVQGLLVSAVEGLKRAQDWVDKVLAQVDLYQAGPDSALAFATETLPETTP